MSAARIEPFRDAGVLIDVEPTTNAGTCKAVGQTVLSAITAKQLDEQTLFDFGEVFREVDGADRVVRPPGSRPLDLCRKGLTPKLMDVDGAVNLSRMN